MAPLQSKVVPHEITTTAVWQQSNTAIDRLHLLSGVWCDVRFLETDKLSELKYVL